MTGLEGDEGQGSPLRDKLRLVDLFAGCGGLTSGFVATGRYRSVAAVEQNFAAASTYAANFGEEHIYCGDITDWVSSGLPEADIVVGGPPCQGFSNLGSRNTDDPRNDLWRQYVASLQHIKPSVFVLENVPQFEKSDQFQNLRGETYHNGLLRDYRLRYKVVRATDYGAAQLRHRFIVIGTHRSIEEPIEIPDPTVEEDQWKTVRDVIGDLHGSVDPGNTSLPDNSVEFFGRRIGGKFEAKHLDFARRYTDLSYDRMRHIPIGGNRFNLPDRLKAPCWIGRTSGSHDVYGRLHWDRPSVTIRTEFFKPEKGRYLHPVEDRALSHHEAARIQGFDDTFEWCGSKIEIARQIGNAVPVPLAKELAAHIAKTIA